MQRRAFLARSAARAAAATAAPWTWSSECNGQSIIRYPNPAVVTFDRRFDKENNAWQRHSI